MRHFVPEFTQQDIDLNKDRDGRYTKKTFGARPCTLEDFHNQTEYFNRWKHSHILCPDIPEDNEMLISGDLASKQSKRMQFSLKKCDNAERLSKGLSECALLNETERYLRDVEIESWALYHMMDMENLYW